MIDLIEFERLLSSKGEDEAIVQPSFLEVIEQDKRENTVSAYLRFLLQSDVELLDRVLEHAFPGKNITLDSIDSAETEVETYDYRRMDIVIEARYTEDRKVLVVIENKIYSCEHDDQCRRYYEYCQERYENHSPYFLFLYPDYNIRVRNQNLSDPHFVKITYTELYEALKSLDEPTKYEKDFMDLIDNSLRSKPMDELDVFIAEHYDEIKKGVDDASGKIDSIFNSFKEIYPEHFKGVRSNQGIELETQLVDGKRTLRFYRNISTWWNGDDTSKDERVYFYIELKCEENLHFYVQRTLKVYAKDRGSNTKINRYIRSWKVDHPREGVWVDTCFVFERRAVEPVGTILSDEWQNDLFSKAEELLDGLFENQEKETIQFRDFE